MTPIINPWWFYFADVCGSVNTILGIMLVVLIFILSLFFFFMACEFDDFRFETRDKNFVKIMVLAICIVGVPFVIIPSKSTIYKMVAASVVTENNIQAVQGNATEFIEKVAEAINKAKEEE